MRRSAPPAKHHEVEQEHVAQKKKLVAALKETARATKRHHVTQLEKVEAKHLEMVNLSKAHAEAVKTLKGKCDISESLPPSG